MPLNIKRTGGIAQQIREDKLPMLTRAKRKSNEIGGGPYQGPSKKRAAFGDITNAFAKTNTHGQNKMGITKKDQQTSITLMKALTNKHTFGPGKKTFVKKESQKSSIPVKVVSKPKVSTHNVKTAEAQKAVKPAPQENKPILQENKPSTSTEMPDFVETMNQKNLPAQDSPSVEIKNAVAAISLNSKEEEEEEEELYIDIDAENTGDPNLAPTYAAHIFQYLKEKEAVSVVDDYFERQKDITRHMRAVLVDWLVEVQENFELNHETLYLAVKLTDMYLARSKIIKDHLQLLGATCLFISCKFDERIPPALDDFLYICDDAYTRTQFTDMERKVLKTVDFYLGVPLSYRFLRRFAKCAHASLETLTLARFILELSLMDSTFITVADSVKAASALLLAFRMKNNGTWDATLRHYSGYKEEDLKQCTHQLNAMLNKPPSKQLATVRNKYSHPLFYEVALIPCMDSLEL